MKAQVEVIIGAQRFAWGDGRLLGGKVHRAHGKQASSAQLTFSDPRGDLRDTLPLPFARERVEVWAGFGAPELLFTGQVSRLSWGSDGRLDVQAADRSVRLRRIQRARNLTNLTLAKLAAELAREEELELDVSEADGDATLTRFASILQHGETDWEMLERVASWCGHTVEVRGEALVLRSLGGEGTSGALRLEHGDGVLLNIQFEVSRPLPSKTGKVKSRAGEVVGEDRGEAEARAVLAMPSGLVDEDMDEQDDAPLDLARVARARRRRRFEAQAQLARLPVGLRLGQGLEVVGYGARFGGVWIVDGYDVELASLSCSLSLYTSGEEAR
jgi:phage protein D